MSSSASHNGNGRAADDVVEIAVSYIEAPGRGWVADAAEIRSVASGATQDEALQALWELARAYPELLDEIRSTTTNVVRRFEKVPA